MVPLRGGTIKLTFLFIGRFWKFLHEIGVEFHQEFIKDIRFRPKLKNKKIQFFSKQKIGNFHLLTDFADLGLILFVFKWRKR